MSYYRDKQQRFSLRKLSVGLISATIASVFLGFHAAEQQVLADDTQLIQTQKQTVGYYHVTESELTKEEEKQIIKELPNILETGDKAYYLVYRPQQAHLLPQTGDADFDKALMTLAAGAGLLVVVIKRSKKRRDILLSFFALTTAGTMALSPNVSALKSELLSNYNQIFNLATNEKLPAPTQIDGYEYIGYLKVSCPVPSNSQSEQPSHPEKNREEGQVVEEKAETSQIHKNNEASPEMYEDLVQIETIPFEQKVIKNPGLYEGETRVQQEGQDGEQQTVIRNYLKDGNLVRTEELSRHTTKEPIPRIVEIGSKVKEQKLPDTSPIVEEKPAVETVVEEQIEVVPFETVTISNAELDEGETRIVQAGQNGERRITKHSFLSDGQILYSEIVSEQVAIPVQDQIIEVGTKTHETKVPNTAPMIKDNIAEVITADQTETEVIPFETVEVQNGELYERERRVRQEGINGEKRITTRTHTINGEVIETETFSEVTPAQQQIIEVGTKTHETKVPNTAPMIEDNIAEVITEDQTETEVIPFETVEVQNGELYEGERRVRQEGINGEKRITTRTHTINGEVIETETFSEVTPAQQQIIEVGTKTHETKVPNTAPMIKDNITEVITEDQTETEVIPFETVEVNSEELYEGETRIKQVGVVGERTRIIREHLVNGEMIHSEEVSNEVSKQPINQIIQIGTKKKITDVSRETPVVEDTIAVITEEVTTSRVDIPFEERIIEDPERYEDEAPIIQEGQVGAREIRVIRELVNGEVLNTREESTVLTQPQNRLVTVGTKVDKRALQAEYDKLTIKEELLYKQAELQKRQAYDQALQAAYVVLNDYNVKKDSVKTALEALTAARIALDGRLKTEPTLEIATVTPNVNEKTAAVSFTLNDTDEAAISSKLLLYKGDELIREIPINSIKNTLSVSDLEYYVDYSIKTELTYDLGNGQTNKLQKDTDRIRLEYKKIEIKDIDSAELYHVANGKATRRLALTEQPTDPANYFVRIKSDRFKDALLPVKSFELDTENKVYKTRLAIPELVHDKSGKYADDLIINIAKADPAPNTYTSFKELVQAMRANPAGTFTLASDMSATEFPLAASEESYIPNTFTGSVVGQHNGQHFAIFDLNKPLFHTIKNATVSNLDLKSVNIRTNQKEVASLAKVADASTIRDVSAQGTIVAPSNVGGIVFRAEKGSQINNTSFTGDLTSTSSNAPTLVGGIAGVINDRKTLVTSSRADVNITITANTNNHKAGALVAHIDSATLKDSVARGTVTNHGTGGQIGGVVGSTYINGRVQNIINEVAVTNGNIVHGDANYRSAAINTIYNVVDKASGRPDQWSNTTVSQQEAAEKETALNITTTLNDSSQATTSNQYSIDYTTLPKASKDRAVAYHNIERLMPFYNKELVVYYGNQVPTDSKLYTTKIVDVVPMNNDTIIINAAANKTAINKLMVHYADQTLAYLPVTYKEDFANTHVSEYTINGTPLIYTPEQMVSSYDNIVNRLAPTLRNVVFDSEKVRKVIGLKEDTNSDKLSYLYLAKTFETVKESINDQLIKALSMSHSINTRGKSIEDYLVDKITTDKEAFLIGLSYMQRWYNINYGEINTKDLNTFKYDFFGDTSVDTIDALIAVGKSGYQNLVAKNNVNAYNSLLAAAKGKKDLFSYIETYRELFLPDKTNNEWLKENSKAYIVETLSDIPELREKQLAAPRDNKFAYGVYDKLTQKNWTHRNMVLPLLTLSDEHIYVISNISTISFGGYEGYRYQNKETDLKTYVRKSVDQQAIWQRDHFDFWYKMLKPEIRERMARSIGTYDGFLYKDSEKSQSWRTLDDQDPSIQEFFGPISKWYRNNGLGAYADGSTTHFVRYKLLNRVGASAFTHEMVHNFDGWVYFGGHGRREGLGAETYALGLLQAPYYMDSPAITINHIFNNEPDNEKRLHTLSPNTRFTNPDDLQSYMHGMFDMIYTLDYAEGQSVLAQSNDVKKVWFRKMENYYVKDKNGRDTHAGDNIVPLTDEDVAKLTTFDSLIDNSIIGRREYSEGRRNRDDYYTISMFSPIYSAISNPHGAPGDLMFRRTAMELLAAKGYHDGFVPYASGQLNSVAEAEGSTIYSNWFKKDIPLVTDEHVFKHVFKNDNYTNWVDFKKAMYKERIDKLASLKPITIRYEVGNPETNKEITISSYQDLQYWMDKAVAYDATWLPNAVNYTQHNEVDKLKKKIYNAYLRLTNDFRESIFN